MSNNQQYMLYYPGSGIGAQSQNPKSSEINWGFWIKLILIGGILISLIVGAIWMSNTKLGKAGSAMFGALGGMFTTVANEFHSCNKGGWFNIPPKCDEKTQQNCCPDNMDEKSSKPRKYTADCPSCVLGYAFIAGGILALVFTIGAVVNIYSKLNKQVGIEEIAKDTALRTGKDVSEVLVDNFKNNVDILNGEAGEVTDFKGETKKFEKIKSKEEWTKGKEFGKDSEGLKKLEEEYEEYKQNEMKERLKAVKENMAVTSLKENITIQHEQAKGKMSKKTLKENARELIKKENEARKKRAEEQGEDWNKDTDSIPEDCMDSHIDELPKIEPV